MMYFGEIHPQLKSQPKKSICRTFSSQKLNSNRQFHVHRVRRKKRLTLILPSHRCCPPSSSDCPLPQDGRLFKELSLFAAERRSCRTRSSPFSPSMLSATKISASPLCFMNSNTLIKAAKMYQFSEKIKHGPIDLVGVGCGICFVKACIHRD